MRRRDAKPSCAMRLGACARPGTPGGTKKQPYETHTNSPSSFVRTWFFTSRQLLKNPGFTASRCWDAVARQPARRPRVSRHSTRLRRRPSAAWPLRDDPAAAERVGEVFSPWGSTPILDFIRQRRGHERRLSDTSSTASAPPTTRTTTCRRYRPRAFGVAANNRHLLLRPWACQPPWALLHRR